MKKKCAVNKGFLLYKQESNTFSLYKVICKKIPTSIFTKLGYNFFESLVENNIINVFYIKKQNKLASVITVVNHENYNILKKKIAIYLLINPLKVVVNFYLLIKSFFRGSNLLTNKDHLHLLHLVIYKNRFKKINLKRKDNILNFFFKEISKIFGAKILFLCYEKENSKARKFYFRNKFKVYDKRSGIVFVKKKVN